MKKLRNILQEDCWTGYKQVGMKDKGGKKVPNCVPIREEKDEVKSFEDFAETRMGGAEKIVDNAKEKGGLSLLTWHHFKVKLPYYKKAAAGKLDIDKAKKEYTSLLDKLYSSTNEDMNIGQVEFQELLGKLEVLGELIIKNK